MTTLRIKRKPTTYLVIVYMGLRAIASSVLPGGYDVELFMEANVIIALAVMQLLLIEYEVVDSRKSHTSAQG